MSPFAGTGGTFTITPIGGLSFLFATLLQRKFHMTATASENTYDEVPYPKWTHRDTHPRQLEAIATLFGMRPAPITDSRVLEIGESDGPGSGDVRIRDDLGDGRLQLKDNDNGGEGVQRQADLSGAVTASLSYYYRRDALDNANDYVRLEISANGAAGPWTELVTHAGPGTDGAYLPTTFDITPYISLATRIRMVTSPNMGKNDRVWFDEVELQCSP